MSFRSFLELDARLSDQLRVAEKPGFLRNVAAFLAHSGDSVVLVRRAHYFLVLQQLYMETLGSG